MVQEISQRLILHWNYRGFSSFPLELREYGCHIHELYLKYNNIQQLPNWLHRLGNLTNIYLQANSLTVLPDCINSLINLEILDVSQNFLSTIPANVGQLKKLQKIVLTQNKLSWLPETIGELKCLVSLQLNNNSLHDLPYSLSSCISLKELYIDRNLLDKLPNFLTRLPNLQVISACGNQIDYLPSVPFASLRRFHFDDNKRVTHLPYPLACQLSKTTSDPLIPRGVLQLSCYGCFSSNNQSHRSNLQVRHVVGDVDQLFYLYFPPYFKLSKQVSPSLVELVLRFLIKYLFDLVVRIDCDNLQHLHQFCVERNFVTKYDTWVKSLSSFLPETLVKILQQGPMAFCLNPECSVALFCSMYPVIIPKIVGQRRGPSNVVLQQIFSTVFFCSQLCNQRYETLFRETWVKDMLDTKVEWNFA